MDLFIVFHNCCCSQMPFKPSFFFSVSRVCKSAHRLFSDPSLLQVSMLGVGFPWYCVSVSPTHLHISFLSLYFFLFLSFSFILSALHPENTLTAINLSNGKVTSVIFISQKSSYFNASVPMFL